MTETLMARRIRRILLVCNNYDNFSLEEDGRLDMRVSREYSELNLSGPPVFERVSTTREALQRAESGDRWDLVITMYNVGEVDVFDFAARMKVLSPETPVVLLTSFSREVWRQLESRDRSCMDYIFNWNGSTDLIIAIIKLLEDSMNAPEDILEGGVQAILLVEDSVRYYSTYLPLLYKLVLQQKNQSMALPVRSCMRLNISRENVASRTMGVSGAICFMRLENSNTSTSPTLYMVMTRSNDVSVLASSNASTVVSTRIMSGGLLRLSSA